MRSPRYKNKYKPLEAVFGGRALPEGDPASSSAHVGALLLVEGVGGRGRVGSGVQGGRVVRSPSVVLLKVLQGAKI